MFNCDQQYKKIHLIYRSVCIKANNLVEFKSFPNITGFREKKTVLKLLTCG